MRWSLVLLLTATAVAAAIAFGGLRNSIVFPGKKVDKAELSPTDMRKLTLVRLRKFSTDVKVYTARHGLNERYCFLIDMKMASGMKRFFIYDLKNDSVLQSGLVTNGSGINSLADTVIFSNEPGSNCTSLGKYKTGKSYYGKFGLAWKLYGLDKTNSNAFNRFVVLHSHPCVPDNEIAPGEICQSWGCPTVSPAFLSQVKTYLRPSAAPVLLWIFK